MFIHLGLPYELPGQGIDGEYIRAAAAEEEQPATIELRESRCRAHAAAR
jgi:hypothetical protein